MKKGLLVFLILMSVSPLFYPNLSMAKGGHREILATVKRIDGNLVSVKTEEGTMRYFTVTKAEKSGLPPLDRGDQLILEIDKSNQIVEIYGARNRRSV
jgi:hypothetical protein